MTCIVGMCALLMNLSQEYLLANRRAVDVNLSARSGMRVCVATA